MILEDYILITIFLAIFGFLVESRIKIGNLYTRYDIEHKDGRRK